MIELRRARHSIREYVDRPLEPEKLELLKEAVLRSPSSRNLDPWEFICVDDRQLLKKLATCKPHGADFLAHAALGIVVCGDSRGSDTWIEDCAIASILAQMVAHEISWHRHPADDSWAGSPCHDALTGTLRTGLQMQ